MAANNQNSHQSAEQASTHQQLNAPTWLNKFLAVLLNQGLACPCCIRRLELEALKEKEAVRQQTARDLTAQCAQVALQTVNQQSPPLGHALVELARLLIALMDNCVLPADLPAASADDDSLASLERRNLKQLKRLALAQEEVASMSHSMHEAACFCCSLKLVAPASTPIGRHCRSMT